MDGCSGRRRPDVREHRLDGGHVVRSSSRPRRTLRSMIGAVAAATSTATALARPSSGNEQLLVQDVGDHVRAEVTVRHHVHDVERLEGGDRHGGGDHDQGGRSSGSVT